MIDVKLVVCICDEIKNASDILAAQMTVYERQLYQVACDRIAVAVSEYAESKCKKWIPVEERLPEKIGDYWVAMKHLDGSMTIEKMFWRPDWPHKEAWNEVVVAWQPYYCPELFVSHKMKQEGGD